MKTIQQQAQALINLHNKMHEESTEPNKDQLFGKVRELMLINMEKHGALYISDTYDRAREGFLNKTCAYNINNL